jgi:hypothetical protein
LEKQIFTQLITPLENPEGHDPLVVMKQNPEKTKKKHWKCSFLKKMFEIKQKKKRKIDLQVKFWMNRKFHFFFFVVYKHKFEKSMRTEKFFEWKRKQIKIIPSALTIVNNEEMINNQKNIAAVSKFESSNINQWMDGFYSRVMDH